MVKYIIESGFFMWIKTNFGFDTNSEIKYSYEDDNFIVECAIEKECLSECSKLFVYSYSDMNENKLLLGTLIESDDMYVLSKSYSEQYMLSHGIECNKISHFAVTSPDGKILKSYVEPSKDTRIFEDRSIENAKKALITVRDKNISCLDAKHAFENLVLQCSKYKNYPENIYGKYSWYVIDDIKENFGLSSVKHLIYCQSFMNNYIKYGKWYFGIKDNTRFCAAAAECGGGTVFENALDCTSYTECGGKTYCVVGIGLFDDGQYFYKIK